MVLFLGYQLIILLFCPRWWNDDISWKKVHTNYIPKYNDHTLMAQKNICNNNVFSTHHIFDLYIFQQTFVHIANHQKGKKPVFSLITLCYYWILEPYTPHSYTIDNFKVLIFYYFFDIFCWVHTLIYIMNQYNVMQLFTLTKCRQRINRIYNNYI